ncbi:MAG: glycoside hydrolase family 43 protein [Lachnospiraceae bacterium]|nr:glycoside hydrolase family 43 protein [Lachnospiraceae bacterium]
MKKKSFRCMVLGALSMATIAMVSGCSCSSSGDEPETKNTADEEVNLTSATNVAIHDPSIFHDPVSGNYYSYGSHMVAGTSEDMVSWSYICNSSVGTAATNTIFDKSFKEEFKEVFDWLDITKEPADFGLWAIDVTYSEAAAEAGNDPYFMYVSLVNNSRQTAIALATADNPEGPFHYSGTIVCADFRQSDVEAGHTNLLEVLGRDSVADMTAEEKAFYLTANTDAYMSKFVDCIDAAPFYDGDGNFYMVYGSFSAKGGLRILKMDPLTGLRSDDNYDYTDDGLQDPYYGKQIAKKRGEGPYILVVESDQSSTGYYYFLFWSQGVLRATGGYNMRMLRSEYPDHGYVDYMGNDAFSDADTTTLGVRIMDNFQFTCMQYSSAANGGNSAIVRDDGKMFLHYHSKSAHNAAYGKDGFIIKSNQMFLNEDGWLVTTPYSYGGETMRELTVDQVAGDYEFIYHRLIYYTDPGNFNDNFVSSQMITLNKDGSVTGDYEGTWELNGNYFTIKIGENEYKGVTLQQYDEAATRTNTVVFTAIGKDNRTVWGSKIYYDDEKRIAIDYDNIIIPSNATADFPLVTTGRLHSDISWTSDNSAITIDGSTAKVICQDADQTVTLTATAKFGEASVTKTYTVSVPAEEYDIPETISSSSITLPSVTATGAAITWTSSDPAVINTDTGAVNVPSDSSVVVTLTGTVENSTRVITVDVTVMQTPTNIIYSENYDDMSSIDATTPNSLWYSANAADKVTLKNDPDRGQYIQFAPGDANSRGALSTLPVDAQVSGVYLMEFDVALTAGNNQTTEIAVVNENLFYKGVINDGIESGFLFRLSATDSTEWSIQNGDSFEIPAGTWVHISALADTDANKVVVTITDSDNNEIYSGTVKMEDKGSLYGIYIRGGRYQSITCIDNVVIKKN